MYEDIHERVNELNQIKLNLNKDQEIESRLQLEFEKYRMQKKQPLDRKLWKFWKQTSVIAAAVFIMSFGIHYVTNVKTPTLPGKDTVQQNPNSDASKTTNISFQLEPLEPVVTGISTLPPEVSKALLAFLEKWAWTTRTHLQQVDVQVVSIQHANGEMTADLLVQVSQRHLDTSLLPELQANIDAYKQNQDKWDESKRLQERMNLFTLYNKLMSVGESPISNNWSIQIRAKETDGQIAQNTLHLFNDIGIHNRQWLPVEEMLNRQLQNPNSEHVDRTHFDEVISEFRQILMNP